MCDAEQTRHQLLRRGVGFDSCATQRRQNTTTPHDTNSSVAKLVLILIPMRRRGDRISCVMLLMLVLICDMTHSYVWYDSFVCVTWRIVCGGGVDSCATQGRQNIMGHFVDVGVDVGHDSFICETWLIVCGGGVGLHTLMLVLMWDMTHSYVWHDSFICETWLFVCGVGVGLHTLMLVLMCDMTHSYVWHDSFICVTWRIVSGGGVDSCATQGRQNIMRDEEEVVLGYSRWCWCWCVTWLIHMCVMTNSVWRWCWCWVTQHQHQHQPHPRHTHEWVMPHIHE